MNNNAEKQYELNKELHSHQYNQSRLLQESVPLQNVQYGTLP